MSCVEKRHRDHRVGSMLHHRFPNGFSDLFMDETDREVSSLTDRAFRSLCVGDDAVYSDDFLSGYSPFSCHKPLADEPFRKKPQKHKHDKSDAKPWKEQQKKNMSSLLRALSAAEESCEGMLMRNGVTADSNGESWDKSALRSIQKELSEFSSSYHSSLTYKQNQNPSNKDVSLPSGKSSKTKNGKAAVKLRKLNIKNFFLHSEFSPFQTWTDFNRFPFSREDAVSNILSAEIPPKWYHLPFYKELTEEEPEEARTRPVAPPPPPKLLAKPAAPPPEKRCSSEGGEGSAAPWRRNRSRAKSAVPANPAAPTAQDTDPKAADESLLSFKKEVKAVEEVSSLASTPFSICQLMTPVIPSRQPTETSEVLQAVLSPSALDLPGRSQSEAKGTPEPPVRRETYKSLASSILFNLKDNRKRVKSRYSPPKFRTLELPEESPESPPSEKLFHLGSEGNPSGLNTPATQAVWSPILEDSNPDPTKPADNRPLPDDYLLANLLQSKWDENIGSPLRHRKANKSPTSRKQSYPSLNLYRKASPGSDDLKECLSSSAVPHANPPNDAQDRPADLPKTTPLSPRDLIPAKDHPTAVSPERVDEKRPPKVPEKTKRALKDEEEKGSEDQKKKEGGGPTVSAMDVIRAAREAISVAKNKAWFAGGSDSEVLQETEDRVSKEPSRSKKEDPEAEESNKKKETLVGKNNHSSKEPPPVPKRNFTKSDLQLPLDKHPTHEADKSSSPKETESVPKERKEGKHAFSARQNNYIKNQRCAEQVDDGAEEDGEGKPHVEAGVRVDERIIAGERPDGRHIENNLQALKELERARLGDGPLEGERQIQTIEEEAKAKNDLICRQLQSIKKEMLSMRGNTSSKREIFAKKEKEQSKQETGTRADGNASRTRLNDNYDRAKMALEEVISERERRRTEPKDQDVRSGFPNSSMEKTSVQRGKTADDGVREEVGSSRKPPEPKDDLQQILSQTEATETQRSGGTMAPPGIDRFAEQLNSKRKAAANQQTANDHVIERGENAKKLETPRVPPRNKKGHKRDESSAKEKGDVCPKETEAGKPDEQVKGRPPGPERSPEEPSGPHTNETSSTRPDGSMCLSPNVRSKDVKKMSLQVKTSPVKDGNLCISEAPEPSAAKQTSPSEPEPRNPTENPTTEEEQEKGLLESPRNFVSPVLQVNGVPLPQSPPDQASLSSKSSYFSVESTLLRSTETESNIYHSLETLTGELEEAEKAGGVVSEVECFSDQEVKEEVLKPPKEPGVQQNIREKSSHEEPDSTSSKTFSPTFSPTLGIPALFKVKDNSVRLKKATPPWTPKAKRPEKRQEVPVVTENPELRVEKEAIHSAEPEVVMSEETSSDQTWNLPPSSLQTQNPNKPPPEGFLAVPQEDDGFSRLTPSSEGVDSATTSTADTVNEVVMSNGAAAEHADAKAPSERSGSTCSGNDSQSGLPKPPAVLPKTEKAVLKAIRLTNRRMKKEEAQKSSKSSQSRSKAERHRRDKSDHNGVKPSKNDEKKHGEKTGDSRSGKEDRSKPTSTHPSQAQANQTSLAQTRDSAESRGRDRRSGAAPDRRGRSSGGNPPPSPERRSGAAPDRRGRSSGGNPPLSPERRSGAAPDRRGRSSGGNPPPSPERRDSSRDRVISSLPVYKAHVAERSASDRPFNRSQSIDRCLGGRAERRLSADAPASDRLDPRSERIEKSIMEEQQQRGRARDKPARENPLRRSHSIDAYGVEARHPASLSRQSSHSGQFSRQSSVEHTIVTQSFPISQRKILQDPDSGQYFFVDLPVQVKTKTFFDPETGSYVQLPVQPPEGAFPQPSPMEVLTPPMVVYHSFVPVPLSPMAQKATIHHVEPHEQRHMDRSRPPPCLEGRPYLEPAYGQHERVMVGEFLGAEGLDCPS